MFLQAVYDHDIRAANSIFPDFSVCSFLPHHLPPSPAPLATIANHPIFLILQRAAFSFPFIDRLNDNTTSFRFNNPWLLSPNPLVLAGSRVYGPALPGAFEPACEGYAVVPNTAGKRVYFKGQGVPDVAAPLEDPSGHEGVAGLGGIETVYEVLGGVERQPFPLRL